MSHKVEFYGAIQEYGIKNDSYDLYSVKGKDPYVGFITFDANISCGQNWDGTCELKMLVGEFKLLDPVQPWNLTVTHSGGKSTYSARHPQYGLSVTIVITSTGSTIALTADPGQPELEASGSGTAVHFTGSECPAP